MYMDAERVYMEARMQSLTFLLLTHASLRYLHHFPHFTSSVTTEWTLKQISNKKKCQISSGSMRDTVCVFVMALNSAVHLPHENTEISALLLHKCFLSVLIRETWGNHRQGQQLYWVMSYEFVCVRRHCGEEPMAHSESISAICSHRLSNMGHKIGCFIMNLRCSRRAQSEWDSKFKELNGHQLYPLKLPK